MQPVNSSDQVPTKDMTGEIIYVVQGTVMCLVNLIIFAAIYSSKKLRQSKEFLPIAWLAAADAIYATGFMSGGAIRISMIVNHTELEHKSSWHCMTMIYNLIWVLSAPSMAMMMLAVSCDRLVAVSSPLFYYKQTSRYAYRLIAPFLIIGVGFSISFFVASFLESDKHVYHALCFTSSAIGHVFMADLYYNQRVVTATLSVVVYFLVPVAFYFRRPDFSVVSSQQKRQHLINEKRLTITVGWSVLFTVLFMLCPNIVRFVFSGSKSTHPELWSLITQTSAIVQNLNSMSNIVLYFSRQKELRMVVRRFLHLKQPAQTQTIRHIQIIKRSC